MLTFTDLLDDMASCLDSPNPELLILLVDRLRPASSRDDEDIHHRLSRLIDTLRASPERCQVLHDYVLSILTTYHQVGLYADSGILGNEGFFTAVRQRIGWRFLPPLRQSNQLRDLFSLCFHEPTDARWIRHIRAEDWDALFELLSQVHSRQDLLNEVRSRVLSAIMIVSYRITSIGIEPELIRAYPAINEFKSPFLVQNREVIDYVECFKRILYAERHPDEQSTEEIPLADERPALVMLDQCRDILNRIKKNTRKQGVSLSLTNLLIRLEQCLNRIELLFKLLHQSPEQVRQALAEMLRLATRAQREESSVRALISINTELMAQQVTENASRTG
ncbi:MAG: recombinase, partial [Pseudomonadota bacterium]|nr:recombinase [Pseudomonadota bacterium]